VLPASIPCLLCVDLDKYGRNRGSGPDKLSKEEYKALIDEVAELQVTVLGMLQSNLNSLDFSLLLPDVIGYRGRGGCAVDAVDG